MDQVDKYFGRGERKQTRPDMKSERNWRKQTSTSNSRNNWKSSNNTSNNTSSNNTSSWKKGNTADANWTSSSSTNKPIKVVKRHSPVKSQEHIRKERISKTTSRNGWKPKSIDTSTDEGRIEFHTRAAQGHLNKMSPANFDRLSEKFLDIAKKDDDLSGILKILINKIFEQALHQPSFCHIYANLCQIIHRNMKSFRRYLLMKCQDEFERDDETPDLEGEELTIYQFKSKKRTLGNIKFIGELYKNDILVEPVMYECLNRLLRKQTPENPDEENIEALCDLMVNIGSSLDTEKNQEKIDNYFDDLRNIQKGGKVTARIRFMIEDLYDLRNNHWKQ